MTRRDFLKSASASSAAILLPKAVAGEDTLDVEAEPVSSIAFTTPDRHWQDTYDDALKTLAATVEIVHR